MGDDRSSGVVGGLLAGLFGVGLVLWSGAVFAAFLVERRFLAPQGNLVESLVTLSREPGVPSLAWGMNVGGPWVYWLSTGLVAVLAGVVGVRVWSTFSLSRVGLESRERFGSSPEAKTCVSTGPGTVACAFWWGGGPVHDRAASQASVSDGESRVEDCARSAPWPCGG